MCISVKAVINSGSEELFHKRKGHKLNNEAFSLSSMLRRDFCITAEPPPPLNNKLQRNIKGLVGCCCSQILSKCEKLVFFFLSKCYLSSKAVSVRIECISVLNGNKRPVNTNYQRQLGINLPEKSLSWCPH